MHVKSLILAETRQRSFVLWACEQFGIDLLFLTIPALLERTQINSTQTFRFDLD